MVEPWREARQKRGLGLDRPKHTLREIVNAILYMNCTGFQRADLPHNFPPYRTVHNYYRDWKREGS
ncbi:transposase [Haloglycomyces albus]|uniref:transposase n=1 Tax=Haloglycomyces albus TaxID=526067 RepID=UPI0012EC2ED7